jgi:hypothetical protein
MNNVATSNKSITTVCPNLIGYFGSGIRPSMLELAALHAAARARRVHLRAPSGEIRALARGPDEPAAAFLARILRTPDERPGPAPAPGATAAPGAAPALAPALRLDQPVLAALYHGDLDLPEGSTCYALFRERAGATISASSLIAPAP